jgi:hypothetical protein
MRLFTFYILLLISSHLSVAQNQLFVSVSGNDLNSGTRESPLSSIQKAIDLAVSKNITEILLLEGNYYLTKPIVLQPKHSGITIRSFEQNKVVISGGRELTGWKEQKDGRWVIDIPEVKAGKWKFRQLYINDELRNRARKPNSGFLKVKGMPEGTPKTVGYHTDCQSFEFAKGDMDKNWSNLEDVEVIVYHFWTDSHLPIESIDESSNTITFRHKAGKVFTDDFSEDGARYIVENVFEELDVPGEWYLNRKTGLCYYFPYGGEEIQTSKIFAPVAGQLIRFEGDPASQSFIKEVHFRNLEFNYTNFELPEGDSNDKQGSASIPAAVTMTGTQNCSFSHCRFTNLGTWAIEVNEGCSDNTFSLNEIGHIAAGGFRVNGGKYDEHPLLRTKNISIKQNHIHHYGKVYPSAVGILLQNTEANDISQNLIHHGFYTGISVGWEWGYQRSISRDNLIQFNHIHHIGQGLLSDMGAIYTLGVSPGTVIRNNLIHDVDANHYGGWGIYNDEGSTHILVENNVVYNTKFAAYNIHFAKEVIVRNNIFALGRLQQVNRTRSEAHKSVYFENNIIYWKEGILFDGDWENKPYKFYFHPKNETGIREVKETFDSDFNIFFNPLKSLDDIEFNEKKWEEWQTMGKDIHSVYIDPLFEDVANYNFRLKKDSPAFKLGFKVINTKLAGLDGAKVGPVIQ